MCFILAAEFLKKNVCMCLHARLHYHPWAMVKKTPLFFHSDVEDTKLGHSAVP